MKIPKQKTHHRFLDESGDTTFFGKGRVSILWKEGVSKCFCIWMVDCKSDIKIVRDRIIKLQKQIEEDEYFRSIPSIQKKIKNGGFYFHAKDDIPEVRKIFFDFLKKELYFTCEVIVARKIESIFINKHSWKDDEFYADILSHLLKSKFSKEKLVLNIAERGSSTRSKNLENALKIAQIRKKLSLEESPFRFNIQSPTREPLLAIPDYALWSVQRVFEKWETRYYDYISESFPLIIDIYDVENYKDWGNYYSRAKKLSSENKIKSP